MSHAIQTSPGIFEVVQDNWLGYLWYAQQAAAKARNMGASALRPSCLVSVLIAEGSPAERDEEVLLNTMEAGTRSGLWSIEADDKSIILRLETPLGEGEPHGQDQH